MSENDLNSPVQPKSLVKRMLSGIANPLAIATGVFAGSFIVLFMWLLVAENPYGGEPVVVLQIGTEPATAMPDTNADGLGIRNALNTDDPDDIADPNADANQNVAANGEVPLEPLDLQFQQQNSQNQQPQTQAKISLPTAPAEGLVEQSVHGPLPQISAAGKTPAVVYARPVSAEQADRDTAKIAILIGGMGLSASGTSVAINRLPEEVTLAFAPYAKALQEWVHKARQNGHEVMLQLPMEPFDYPDNDPGPHTLLSSLPPQDNVRRLEWLLARFTGYFGVTNFMGAKFTSSVDALRPVFRQINRRGLVYLEDGSSARSLSEKTARQIGLKATSGDLILDNNPTAKTIDAALAQLETIALERGIAVGIASGLPVTVERIAVWSQSLQTKGIVLVPVSATITLRQNLS